MNSLAHSNPAVKPPERDFLAPPAELSSFRESSPPPFYAAWQRLPIDAAVRPLYDRLCWHWLGHIDPEAPFAWGEGDADGRWRTWRNATPQPTLTGRLDAQRRPIWRPDPQNRRLGPILLNRFLVGGHRRRHPGQDTAQWVAYDRLALPNPANWPHQTFVWIDCDPLPGTDPRDWSGVVDVLGWRGVVRGCTKPWFFGELTQPVARERLQAHLRGVDHQLRARGWRVDVTNVGVLGDDGRFHLGRAHLPIPRLDAPAWDQPRSVAATPSLNPPPRLDPEALLDGPPTDPGPATEPSRSADPVDTLVCRLTRGTRPRHLDVGPIHDRWHERVIESGLAQRLGLTPATAPQWVVDHTPNDVDARRLAKRLKDTVAYLACTPRYGAIALSDAQKAEVRALAEQLIPQAVKSKNRHRAAHVELVARLLVVMGWYGRNAAGLFEAPLRQLARLVDLGDLFPDAAPSSYPKLISRALDRLGDHFPRLVEDHQRLYAVRHDTPSRPKSIYRVTEAGHRVIAALYPTVGVWGPKITAQTHAIQTKPTTTSISNSVSDNWHPMRVTALVERIAAEDAAIRRRVTAWVKGHRGWGAGWRRPVWGAIQALFTPELLNPPLESVRPQRC